MRQPVRDHRGRGKRETRALTHLLDVVVGEGPAVLQLLSGEDKTLLVGGDALLVLNLGLHIVDRVRGLDLKGDGLARQGLDEAIRYPSVFRGSEGWAIRYRPYICTIDSVSKRMDIKKWRILMLGSLHLLLSVVFQP